MLLEVDRILSNSDMLQLYIRELKMEYPYIICTIIIKKLSCST